MPPEPASSRAAWVAERRFRWLSPWRPRRCCRCCCCLFPRASSVRRRDPSSSTDPFPQTPDSRIIRPKTPHPRRRRRLRRPSGRICDRRPSLATPPFARGSEPTSCEATGGTPSTPPWRPPCAWGSPTLRARAWAGGPFCWFDRAGRTSRIGRRGTARNGSGLPPSRTPGTSSATTAAAAATPPASSTIPASSRRSSTAARSPRGEPPGTCTPGKAFRKARWGGCPFRSRESSGDSSFFTTATGSSPGRPWSNPPGSWLGTVSAWIFSSPRRSGPCSPAGGGTWT
mmetsp:Transcript_1217/g.2923  ORF Transcript_1217/g.2923 Transcript_1217/m.2923 type:complete len:285 (+) Transcript_1217:82-936(+)